MARGAQIGQGVSHGPEGNVYTVDADGVANITGNVVYCWGECRCSAVFGGAPGGLPGAAGSVHETSAGGESERHR